MDAGIFATERSDVAGGATLAGPQDGRLFEPEDGDAEVRCPEIRIAAEGGRRVEEVEHDGVEDVEAFAGDEVLDDPFLFTQRKGFAEAVVQGAAFAAGAVAVDEFQDAHALLPGVADFLNDVAAGLVERGHAGFDVEGAEHEREYHKPEIISEKGKLAGGGFAQDGDTGPELAQRAVCLRFSFFAFLAFSGPQAF